MTDFATITAKLDCPHEVIGPCLLIQGDCLKVLPLLETGSVDAVVTDPPYGIGIANNPFRQKHEKKDWDDSVPSNDAILQIIGMADVAIVWGGNYFDLPPTQCFLVWDKVQPEDFTSAMVEMAWTNLSRPAKMLRRHVVSYEKFHPTTKPLELMAWCLGFIPKATTILDPFTGSGTTGVACIHTGRRFIGIELDPGYFRIACDRIRRELETYQGGPMFAPKADDPALFDDPLDLHRPPR